MPRVIPVIIVIALTIYAVVDLVQSPGDEVRFMPKWLWAVVVIVVVGLGPLLWIFFGRPRSGPRPSDPIPPDDDPNFLRGL